MQRLHLDTVCVVFCLATVAGGDVKLGKEGAGRATFCGFLPTLPPETTANRGFADKYACQALQNGFIVVHHLRMTRMFARHFFTAYFYFSNSNPKAVE
ncbi:hypothetical protein [Janthinobacterium sp. J1-1]|uniref:hypothetical protein n=1 Tax=Janthinobacterium sp. J1-1 TaxID=3065910 RepID=UPI0028121BBF|nr:hypothetical protein [Janthinobacterium sp. J1-1]